MKVEGQDVVPSAQRPEPWTHAPDPPPPSGGFVDLKPLRPPGLLDDAKPHLYGALAAFQAELPQITKNQTAKVQMKSGGTYSYQYAGLPDVSIKVMPLLGKHGLAFISKPTVNEHGKFCLKYALVHASGEREDGEYPLRTGTPQEMGSEITYARRYCLTAIIGVAAEEDDDAHLVEIQALANQAFDIATAKLADGEVQEAIDMLKTRVYDVAASRRGRLSARAFSRFTGEEATLSDLITEAKTILTERIAKGTADQAYEDPSL
jgi:hypothetical protein